jgi:hypothetical protein
MTKFFIKKNIKNAEFHVDFESVEKFVQKCTKKSYKQNKFDELWCIFSKLFQNSAFFDTHIEFLRKIDCKCTGNGSKKWKILFIYVP